MKKKLQRQLTNYFRETKNGAGVKYPDNPWTIPHVEDFLGCDISELPEDAQKVITRKCSLYAIVQGFENDKSFAKWYLTTYHAEVTETATEGNNSNHITIGVIDAS